MQILVDIRLLARGGTSGIEEYVRNLLMSLLTLDERNNFTLFYNGLRPASLNDQFLISNSKTKIINWRIPNKILDSASRFLNWPKIDDLIKTDVVFSPHFNILKTKKAPRVITFHDLSFLHHPQFFSWKQKFWHWLQDIKKQAQEADRIIAVSEFTKSDLINLLGVPAEKISVIYSGISGEFSSLRAERSNLEIAAPRNSGARNDQRPYILYLGTLEPRKNVPAIIRAFNVLKHEVVFKDWQLIIAGRPGWLYRDILKEAGRSPYKKDIIFKGAISADDRILLYNLAKVFVYPSFFEGFGFPPLEAQACGCPVVVSDRTSLPEVLGDSALFVNPWKVEDLTARIREAALNESMRQKLIEAGYSNAKKFNWHKTAQETLKCLTGFLT